MTDAVFYISYPDTYKYIYTEGERLMLRTVRRRCPVQTSTLCGDCRGSFCAWQDGYAIHLIYSGTHNKVKYIRLSENNNAAVTLNTVRGGTVLSGFDVSPSDRGGELYYTAASDGSCFLLKCRLDNNEPPQTVSALADDRFYTDGEILCYTASDGTLTALDLSRNRHFVISENGSVCHSIVSPHGRLFTYIKDGGVYFSDIRLCDCADAEYPTIVSGADSLMIQWRSKNMLCYCTSRTGGKNWSGVRKLIYSGMFPVRFCIFNNGSRHYVYGTRKKTEISLFEHSAARTDSAVRTYNDSRYIRLRLEKTEKEPGDPKKRQI